MPEGKELKKLLKLLTGLLLMKENSDRIMQQIGRSFAKSSLRLLRINFSVDDPLFIQVICNHEMTKIPKTQKLFSSNQSIFAEKENEKQKKRKKTRKNRPKRYNSGILNSKKRSNGLTWSKRQGRGEGGLGGVTNLGPIAIRGP